MNQGKIVFEGKTSKGLEIIIRHATLEDASKTLEYINTLSSERTFVLLQGEQLTLDEEIKFINKYIEPKKDFIGILLFVFHDMRLIGIANLDMGSRAIRHIGIPGLSVAKDFRSKGVGRLLFESLINEAVKAIPNLEIIDLGVFANNPVARKLYTQLGFIEYGFLPNGIKREKGYVDHINMYKVVRPPAI